MTDPEVERIAEMCWRAFARSPHGDWIEGASAPEVYAGALATDWRAVARAVIADRAARPPVPVTDGPTLMEAIRERDDARRDAKRTAAECDRAVADARRERDAARTRAVAAERARDEAHRNGAAHHDAAERYLRERDDLQRRLVAVEEIVRFFAGDEGTDPFVGKVQELMDCYREAERERDTLQSRLDAMRREPTEADVRELREHITGSPLGWDDLSREAWIIVRDALLTAQGPAVVSAVESAGPHNPGQAPAPIVPHGEWTPERVAAFNAPFNAPALSAADILDGAEEMLRRIAAATCLDLDATEAAAIVAELDRLRAENDALRARAIVAETRHAAESEHLISHGRSVERAAVVAWLHQCGAAPADVTSHSLHDAADSIQRGGHLAAKERP